jgi:type VI secretion system secreted protein Hcp
MPPGVPAWGESTVIKLCRSLTLVLSAVTLFAAWGVDAKAQEKTFVLVSGGTITGESTDAAHPNWIDAYALDVPVNATFSGSIGTTHFQDVSFLKGTDKATSGLYDGIARGVNFALVTAEVCRSTAPQQCYFKVELTNAKLTSVDLSGSSCVGSGACTPAQTESVSFTYTRIKWTYTPWTGGVAGTPIVKCWDLTTASSC